MKRVAGSLILVAVVCLLGASSSPAYVIDYKEGNTNVGFPTSTVRWSVKPNSGVNKWYWYINNNLGVNTAVCYRYQVAGDIIRSPNGSAYGSVSTGGTGALPVATNASTCEGPYVSPTAGWLPKNKQITGLTNGTVATYCAEEWFKQGGTWQNSADPERCESIVADTTSPTTSVDLRQGGSSVTTTNSPGSVQTRINYSDSLTPPWRAGSVFGDNRLCTSTSSACISSNTFNYVSACSQGTESFTQSFDCPMGTPPGDGNFFQCFASFDGAVLDAEPSLLADANTGNDDPAFTTTNIQTFNAGTGNYAIACDSVMVDTTAPNTTITAGPANGSSSTDTTPTFSFNSSEGGSTFQCKIDGGAFAACSSPHTTTALGGGSHTFQVKATDGAGNTDASPDTRTFTITGAPDTTPPDTSITAGPAEGSTTGDSTPEFSFSSTEGGSTFQCRVDSAPFAACTSPHSTAGLVNGPHTFQVYATDGSNNPDTSPASRSFTVAVSGPVDTTPPDTSITAGPAAGATINTKTPTLSFRSTETGSTFECKVDSGDFAPCTSPHTTASLGIGSHTFSVRATDERGNTDGSPATRSFTVSAGSGPGGDTTPPQTTIKTKPRKSSTRRKAKFTFSSSEAGSTFTCKLDKAAARACSSPFSRKVKPGKHKISVWATDRAGNKDDTPAIYAWTVKKPRR